MHVGTALPISAKQTFFEDQIMLFTQTVTGLLKLLKNGQEWSQEEINKVVITQMFRSFGFGSVVDPHLCPAAAEREEDARETEGFRTGRGVSQLYKKGSLSRYGGHCVVKLCTVHNCM
jgi:hypothetical protein